MAKTIKVGAYSLTKAQLITAVAGFVLVVGTVGGVWFFQRVTAMTKAAAWTPVGAPCPSLSKSAFAASGAPAGHVTDYDNVRFARGYGYVTCDEIGADGGRSSKIVSVCQFNNPSALQVTTSRGDFYYVTGASPATVMITDGAPRCVMAVSQSLG
jgi:hypothetical protein